MLRGLLDRSDPLTSLLRAHPSTERLADEFRDGNTEGVIRRAIASLPHDLQRMLAAPDADLSVLARVARGAGLVTLGELSWALAQEGSALDPVVADDVRLLARAVQVARGERRRLPLGRALAVSDAVRGALAGVAGVSAIEAVGSLRRFDATVGDIELLAVSSDGAAVLDRIASLPGLQSVRYRGPARVTLDYGHEEITLRVVEPRSAGPAIVHYTGSASHLRALEAHASGAGLRLSPTALVRSDGARLDGIETEEAVYERLGLAYIAPELREGAGEVEAAAAGRLPRLVRVADIRGDLHVHSLWSDGRDTIEDMVREAQRLGYEYVAITDHSRATLADGLDGADVLRQADEIARIRDEVPGITVLHGIEVDILPDGRLDMPDDILARLDLVLASLHDPAGHGPERLVERYVGAMRHPLVHVITHPANRIVGGFGGYVLDFDRLADEAVATGTVLEIDGAPIHLDMDGTLARRAVQRGATVTIDSDCHRREMLGRQMSLGVATARRGWVEPHQVLNTRNLAGLLDELGRKRR